TVLRSQFTGDRLGSVLKNAGISHYISSVKHEQLPTGCVTSFLKRAGVNLLIIEPTSATANNKRTDSNLCASHTESAVRVANTDSVDKDPGAPSRVNRLVE